MAQDSSAAAAAGGGATLVIPGEMAARVDRLPMSLMAWEICLIVQVGWACAASTDGIAQRLYPFVWLPAKVINHTQYDVLYALQVGISILLGGYALGWLADKIGRRKALILSSLLAGAFIWPFGYVTNFSALFVLSIADTLGFAGFLAINVVYMSEIMGPEGPAQGDDGLPGRLHLPAPSRPGGHRPALPVPRPVPGIPVDPDRAESRHRGTAVLADARVAALAGGQGAPGCGAQGGGTDGGAGQQGRPHRAARARPGAL